MGDTPIAPGDVVYLVAELGSGDRIHEIGTRACVVAVDASSVTLELGEMNRETVSCAAAHVSSVRRRDIGGRSRGAFRPATA